MFGRRRRRDEELATTIRWQLASSSSEALIQIAAAMSQMESRLASELEERARLHQTCTEIKIESMGYTVRDATADVAAALGKVAEVYGVLIERLEADRRERRELSERIALLAPAAAKALSAPDRPIGGTVFAPPELVYPDEISLVGADAAEPPPPFAGARTDDLDAAAVRVRRQSPRG